MQQMEEESSVKVFAHIWDMGVVDVQKDSLGSKDNQAGSYIRIRVRRTADPGSSPIYYLHLQSLAVAMQFAAAIEKAVAAPPTDS